jgi:pimeloyl-ACP methyl ester carboxylesterase
MADAGHGYMWERPEEFNRLSLEFLAKHAGR